MSLARIRKRDRAVVDFDAARIGAAIARALSATREAVDVELLTRAAGRALAGLLWLGIVLLPAEASHAAERQAWMNNSLKVGLTERWYFKATNELRFAETDFDDTLLRNWNAGFFVDLPANFYVGGSYKREELVALSPDLDEDRYVFEGGWKRAFIPRLKFDARFRFEDRNFDDPRISDRERYRLKLRVKTPTHLGRMPVEPYFWIELFSVSGNKDTLERTRIELGTTFKAHEHVSFFVGYLRQNISRPGISSINAVSTGVDFSF